VQYDHDDLLTRSIGVFSVDFTLHDDNHSAHTLKYHISLTVLYATRLDVALPVHCLLYTDDITRDTRIRMGARQQDV
jgi:hypothetical protein